MKAKIFGSLLVAILAITSIAQAQTRNQYYNRQYRVTPADRYGNITPREARQIQMQRMDLDREIRRAYADGRVSRGEQMRIQRERDQLNFLVRHSQNNGFRRY